MNLGTLHGENSIHILNRILIQSAVDEEQRFQVNQCLQNICAEVAVEFDQLNASSIMNIIESNSSSNLTGLSRTTTTERSILYSDKSFYPILLGYGIMKQACVNNHRFENFVNFTIKMNIPLLSGFCASFLPNEPRPLSTITYLPPLNKNPSSLETSQDCLKSTKESLINTGYQEEAIIVVDEKIYRNCAKVSYSIALISVIRFPIIVLS